MAHPAQYAVNPYKDEGCTTCKHYHHTFGRCLHGLKANAMPHEGYYVGIGLSPCPVWVKGFEHIPDSLGQFRIVEGKV